MNREINVLAKYIVEMDMDINWPDDLKRSNNLLIKEEFAFNYLCVMLRSYKQAVNDRKFVNEWVEIDQWIEDDL